MPLPFFGVGIGKLTIGVISALIPLGVFVNNYISNYRKENLKKSETIVAVAVVPQDDGMAHVNTVVAVPPTDSEYNAAVLYYSMWEKINGHNGRPCDRIVPIYADGHISKHAVLGFKENKENRSDYRRYNFLWGEQQESGEIYLTNVSYDLEELTSFNPNHDMSNVVQRLLKTGMSREEVYFVSDHYIEKPFTIQELYGVPKLSDLNPDDIEWQAYDPETHYVAPVR